MTKPIQPIDIPAFIRTQIEAMPDLASLTIHAAPDVSAALKVFGDQVPLGLRGIDGVAGVIRTAIEASTLDVGAFALDALAAATDVTMPMSHTYDVPVLDLQSPVRKVRELERRVEDLEAELRMISPLPDAEDLN